MKRIAAAMGVLVLLVLISMPMPLSLSSFPHSDNEPISSRATTLYVGPTTRYKTIQSAVGEAFQGDTIIVANGTYDESVNVYVTDLVLKGNSSTSCIVDYYYKGNNSIPSAGFNVTATGVTITGFNVQVSGNYTRGIHLKDTAASYATIAGNRIFATHYEGLGIYNYKSPGGNIINNYIETYGSFASGIEIYFATGTNVTGNEVITDGAQADGIYLQGGPGDGNNILGNSLTTADMWAAGIYCHQDDNKLIGNVIVTDYNNAPGIEMVFAERCLLIDNDIDSDGKGIDMQDCDNNLIINATIRAYFSGVFAEGSGENFVTDSNITYVYSGESIESTGSDCYMTVMNTTFSSSLSDVLVRGDSNLTLINCTIESFDVTTSGGGVLQVKNWLNIHTYHDDGLTPCPDVEIQVLDNGLSEYGSPGFEGTDERTDAQGRRDCIPVSDHWYIYSNTPVYNTTDLKVKKTVGKTWHEELYDLDMSQTRTEVFLVDFGPPAVPTGLKATRVPGRNALNITWDPLNEPVNYAVYSDRSGSYELIDNVTHPKNWTVDEDLPDETWHSYKIQAWDVKLQSSNLSSRITFYLTDITPPAVPSGLAVEPVLDGDGLHIFWDENTDDTVEYDVWWNGTATGPWTEIGIVEHPDNDLVFSDPALVNGTTHRFRIRARDKVGLLSNFTSLVSVVHIDQKAPGAPENVTAEAVSASKISLDWDAPYGDTDVERYLVLMNATGDHSGDYKFWDETVSTTYDATGLDEDTVYYFVVRAVDETGTPSLYSQEVWNTTQKLPGPESPRIIDTDPDQNQTDVVVYTDVSITFSLSMDMTSLAGKIEVTPSAEFTLSSNIDNKVLWIDFTSDLDYYTFYSIRITGGMSQDGGDLAGTPFTLKFRTESEEAGAARSVSISAPSEGTEFQPGENLTVSGTSTGFEVGTRVHVRVVNGYSINGTVGGDGAWSVVIALPTEAGSYTIIVEVGGRTKTVNITVVEVPEENGKKGPEENKYAMILLLIILGLVGITILIVLVLVMRKRRRIVSEDVPASEGPPEVEEKKKKKTRRKRKRAGIKDDQTKIEEIKKEAFAEGMQDGYIIAKGYQKDMDLPRWEETSGILPPGELEPPPPALAQEVEPDADDPFLKDIPLPMGDMQLALPPPRIFDATFENLPRVDEVFVITPTGLLLRHLSYKETSLVDEDILASMLTVIQNFVTDSFGKKDTSLKNLGFGEFNLVIMKGKYTTVVAVSTEQLLKSLERPIKEMILEMESVNEAVLKDWDGDQQSVIFLDDYVIKLVNNEY